MFIQQIGYALINIHKRIQSVTHRQLNYYEQKLFKTLLFEVNASLFSSHEISIMHKRKTTSSAITCNVPIVSRKIFENRLFSDFHYSKWRNCVDWDQFWLIGGSVLKCILKQNWNETNIDLDFFANNISYNEYISEIKEFAKRCAYKGYRVLIQENIDDNQSVNNIYVNFARQQNDNIYTCGGGENSCHFLTKCSKSEIESIMDQGIEGQKQWQKFQFIWYDSLTKQELMNIIDIDCCQIGFDGGNVICTYACLQVMTIYIYINMYITESYTICYDTYIIQSISTRTMISYKLVENGKDSSQFLDRILKYIERGFTLIVPHSFKDKYINDAMSLLNQTEKENIYNDMDTDNKYDDFQVNNDTMQVRNKFVDLCSRLKL